MRSSTMDLIFLTVLVAGLVYFSVDALFGRSGVQQLEAVQTDLDERRREIAELEAQRDALAAKVEGLSGETVDPELLDERLRATFGVGRDDETLLVPPR